MATSTEAELAHARDVTITECQEYLRTRADMTVSAGMAFGREMQALAAMHAETLRGAAEGLETLRVGRP